MKYKLKVAAIFFGVCGLGAGLAWLQGYDFNRRGENVSTGAFATIITAGVVAMFLSGADDSDDSLGDPCT